MRLTITPMGYKGRLTLPNFKRKGKLAAIAKVPPHLANRGAGARGLPKGSRNGDISSTKFKCCFRMNW